MKALAPRFSCRCRLSELPARARQAATALPAPVAQALTASAVLTTATALATLALGLVLHACCD